MLLMMFLNVSEMDLIPTRAFVLYGQVPSLLLIVLGYLGVFPGLHRMPLLHNYAWQILSVLSWMLVFSGWQLLFRFMPDFVPYVNASREMLSNQRKRLVQWWRDRCHRRRMELTRKVQLLTLRICKPLPVGVAHSILGLVTHELMDERKPQPTTPDGEQQRNRHWLCYMLKDLALIFLVGPLYLAARIAGQLLVTYVEGYFLVPILMDLNAPPGANWGKQVRTELRKYGGPLFDNVFFKLFDG